MYGIVYKITSPIGKSYIGQTTRPLEVRWRGHIRDALWGKKKSHFLNAIRKYKPKAFTLAVVTEAKNQESLDFLEKYWIKKLDTFNTGYNSTTGGEHPEWRKESRQQLSTSLEKAFFEKAKERILMLLDCRYEIEDIPPFFQRRPHLSEKYIQTDKYKNQQKEITDLIEYCVNFEKIENRKKSIADWEMEEAISGLSH